jgi:hypothetical protein
LGFLDKIKKAADAASQKPEGRDIKLVFGPNLLSGYREIIANPKNIKSVSVTFPSELLNEISESISSHQPTIHVAYSEEMQFLDVVGESFYQSNLAEINNEFGDDWLSGFLMPEPLNPHDTNAVSVLIIGSDEDGDVSAVQVGYLSKDQAKKTHAKISKHLENGLVIPVLLKLTGGETGKENFGVMARAKHSKIKF